METKFAAVTDIKSTDKENRIIEFIATRELVDYDNEIVKVDGMDITKIKKNKSFLWSHNHGAPPVGKIISISKEGKIIKGKAQMTSEVEYPFGYTIYKLIDGGYINNVSIGFMPNYDTITYKDDKSTGKKVRIVNDATMLEVSAVNVGANRAATVSAKSISDAATKAFDENVIDQSELEYLYDELKKFPPEVKVEETNIDNKEYEQKTQELEQKVLELEQKLEEYKIQEELKEVEVEDDYLSELYKEFESDYKKEKEFDNYINNLLVD